MTSLTSYENFQFETQRLYVIWPRRVRNSYNLRQNTTKETAMIIHSNPMTNDEIPAANSPLLS